MAFGEADVIVTFMTEAEGKVSAVLRGGRRSRRRAEGGLEPFHTLRITAEDTGSELLVLRESKVARVRQSITRSLAAIEAAGLVMRWLRHLAPPRHKEPGAWATAVTLLDRLDGGEGEPRSLLAACGLRLLSDVGFGQELTRCVVCGRACPEGRPAYVDAARGGLVCQACGGGRLVLSPAARRAGRIAQAGEPVEMGDDEARELLALVEAALAAHGGFER